jgi:uncharacterized protein
MRALALCFVLIAAPAWAAASEFAAVPPLGGPVVDTAGVIRPPAARAIDTLARDLRAKTGAEIAVLTMKTVAPETAFDFGMRVVDAWKLGSAEKDDGLLLLIVVDDREVRFFQGYGLEGVLPDGRLGEILDRSVLPAFRAGDYGGGAYGGLAAVAEVIAADHGVKLGAPSQDAPRPVAPPHELDVSTLLLMLFVFIVLASIVSTRPPAYRRRGGLPPVFRGGFGGGFGGGGFGGGFGRGGFGGGGGGFGGGGAGRSW